MRHWLVLAAVYAVVAALVLPGSLLASEDAEPAASAEETVATEAAPDQGAAIETELPATPAPEAAPPPEAPAVPEAAPAPEAAPVETTPAEPATPAEPVVAAEEPAEAAKDAKDAKDEVAKAADTANVVISDYRFTPATVTVVEGDTVTWTNDGPSGHSATATEGSFDTGIFPTGESRSATFDEPGTFAYICTPHPNMKGTVVVEAADSDVVDQEEDAQLENDEEALAEDVEADLLPATGKDVQAMIVLGLLMIALGATISLRTRRQS